MSSITKQPVTWQDYADLWGSDPRYKEQYAVIAPTLKALGITPGDIKDGADSEASGTTPPALQASAATDDTIGGDAGQSTAFGAANSFSSRSGYGATDAFSSDSRVGPGFPPQAEPYRDMIESASRATGVPASLIAGVIHDESHWDPLASTVNGGNGGGDTGLMQINDGTFSELQAKHPELAGRDKNDPATNILAGALYLADMKELTEQKYGVDSWEIALRAYNSGPNGVDPNDLHQLPAGNGTWNYVDKVMNYWQIIEAGGTLPL